MELTIQHLGGVKFKAAARGHILVCDQPVENNGEDRGMSPPELMLASLGTCAGYYAAEYLRTRGLPVEGVSVKVSAEKLAQPARLGRFKIEVFTPELNERHTAGIMRAVKSCLIHNTLLNAPEIETVLTQRRSEPALQLK